MATSEPASLNPDPKPRDRDPVQPVADPVTGPVPGRGAGSPFHALVVAAGDVGSRAALETAWPGWDGGVALVVAADSGLAVARELGLEVDLLVGDLDSLDPMLLATAKAIGTQVRRARPDKDESDTELAMLAAVDRGATRITVLGALGGERVDHALSNVWLLAHPALDRRDVVLLDARARVWLLSAPAPDGRASTRAFSGPAGGTISLLPFDGDVEEVTTHGLRYPLRGERLRAGPARGLSNVRMTNDASVTIGHGRLLVIELAPGRGGLSSNT